MTEEKKEIKSKPLHVRFTVSEVGKIRAAAKLQHRTVASMISVGAIEKANSVLTEFQKKPLIKADQPDQVADSILGASQQ